MGYHGLPWVNESESLVDNAIGANNWSEKWRKPSTVSLSFISFEHCNMAKIQRKLQTRLTLAKTTMMWSSRFWQFFKGVFCCSISSTFPRSLTHWLSELHGVINVRGRGTSKNDNSWSMISFSDVSVVFVFLTGETNGSAVDDKVETSVKDGVRLHSYSNHSIRPHLCRLLPGQCNY